MMINNDNTVKPEVKENAQALLTINDACIALGEEVDELYAKLQQFTTTENLEAVIQHLNNMLPLFKQFDTLAGGELTEADAEYLTEVEQSKEEN